MKWGWQDGMRFSYGLSVQSKCLPDFTLSDYTSLCIQGVCNVCVPLCVFMMCCITLFGLRHRSSMQRALLSPIPFIWSVLSLTSDPCGSVAYVTAWQESHWSWRLTVSFPISIVIIHLPHHVMILQTTCYRWSCRHIHLLKMPSQDDGALAEGQQH